MTGEPSVQPLPRSHRRFVFWSFLLIFVVAMPSLWFYTTGYRFDWTNTEGGFVGVGGLYISTDAQNVEFFVDEQRVTDFRIFRKAAYIQNLAEGKHSIHVQGEGMQTWTKDLPVQSYIVTEAFAFMMPATPHIRVITEYQTATGTAVLRLRAPLPPGPYFTIASTTNTYIATTSRATSTLIKNPEYQYIGTLFASSSATSTSLVAQLSDRIERQFVPRAGTSTDVERATTTREDQGMRAFIADGEVNVAWIGDDSERPNYFCVPGVSTSTPRLYGEHVYQDLLEEAVRHGVAATFEAVKPLIANLRLCRDSIRIDRKGKEVRAFEFFPGTPGLMLMLLHDGLYVVEVDDRAWQNTQLLYPGENLMFAIDGGRIYVRDREQYLEVLTTLPN